MPKSKGVSRLKRAEAAVQQSVDDIDDRITELEKLVRPYQKIQSEIDKLRSARRALLGGTKTTGSGGSRVRQQDVVEYLDSNPGSTPGEVAKALGVPQPTVSSHLYRGKDDRFLTRSKRWWNRDPKNGINKIEDIEEDEA